MKQLLFLVLAACIALPATARAAEVDTARLETVLEAQDADLRMRSLFRHPAGTLSFFGVAPGSVVVEALPGGGWYSRMMRSSMVDVLRQDFIRTARSKGLTERSVVLVHALRNAILPVIAMIGLDIGIFMAGAVVVDNTSAFRMVDGVPLASLDVAAWRSRLAWVPQNPYLFNASVLENIRLGRPTATPDEVIWAARQAA